MLELSMPIKTSRVWWINYLYKPYAEYTLLWDRFELKFLQMDGKQQSASHQGLSQRLSLNLAKGETKNKRLYRML